MATDKNLDVQMASQRVKQAEAKVLEARAGYFPSVTNRSNAIHSGETEALTIPAGILGSYSGTGPLPAKDTRIQLGKQDFLVSTTAATQPVTQLFKIHSSVKAAQAEALTAQDELDRTRNEVSLSVKKLYYQFLSLEQHKHAEELRIAAAEQQLKEAQDAADHGVALEVKVLQSRAEMAGAQNALHTLQDNIADARDSLNDLLGLALSTPTEPSEPAEQIEMAAGNSIVLSDVTQLALSHNPEVLSAQHQLAKAHAGLAAAHDEYIPEVSVFAQDVFQNGAPLLPRNSGAAGVQLDWTISEFGRRIGLVRERKSQVAEASDNLRATENRVRIQAESESRKVLRSETTLDAARVNVAARTELVRVIHDQVQARTANESALSDAEAQLAEAKAQLFDAHMQQVVAEAELQRTAGRK